MKKAYILEDTMEVYETISKIAERGLAYDIDMTPICYFAFELTIECDPSDIVEIEQILAPVI